MCTWSPLALMVAQLVTVPMAGAGAASLSHLDGCVFIIPSHLALSSEFPFIHDELLRDQVCILGILPFFFF